MRLFKMFSNTATALTEDELNYVSSAHEAPRHMAIESAGRRGTLIPQCTGIKSEPLSLTAAPRIPSSNVFESKSPMIGSAELLGAFAMRSTRVVSSD